MSSRISHVHQTVPILPSPQDPSNQQSTLCLCGFTYSPFSKTWSHATCDVCVWLLSLNYRFWFRRFQGQSPRFCIYNLLPADADAAGVRMMFGWVWLPGRGAMAVSEEQGEPEYQLPDISSIARVLKHWWDRMVLSICSRSSPQSAKDSRTCVLHTMLYFIKLFLPSISWDANLTLSLFLYALQAKHSFFFFVFFFNGGRTIFLWQVNVIRNSNFTVHK